MSYDSAPRGHGHGAEPCVHVVLPSGAFVAAEQSGNVADLQTELEALFERQNRSEAKDATSIPATFLRVSVTV